MLILFAWGRCWSLSLEAHLFLSNSGSEPRLPPDSFTSRETAIVVLGLLFVGLLISIAPGQII